VHASPGRISTPTKVIKDTINKVTKPNANLLKIKKNIIKFTILSFKNNSEKVSLILQA
jgi:hypothetical protein